MFNNAMMKQAKKMQEKMKVSQEEIFGPVICLIPYKDLNEAVEIALFKDNKQINLKIVNAFLHEYEDKTRSARFYKYKKSRNFPSFEQKNFHNLSKKT